MQFEPTRAFPDNVYAESSQNAIGSRTPADRAIVVVPTYNERETLPALVERVLMLVPTVDLLVVDDNSPDGTGRLADALAAGRAGVNVLHRAAKGGLGRAYCAGFSWALERGFEFICEMDGDLSHNPGDLPRLIEAARDADLALGSRYLRPVSIVGWPLHRFLLSKGAGHCVRIATGMPFADPTGGFRCFRRHTLASVDLPTIGSNGYCFQIELLHRVWRRRLKIVEIPIIFTERAHGRSKMSLRDIREALFLVWRLFARTRFRRRPPMRLARDNASADA